MCGIAGCFTPGAPADANVLDAMVARLRHRGPDGSAAWVEGDVALGMARLAIVDVEHGQQPLENEDGSIRMVFNGEIYNHRELRSFLTDRGHALRSETDGEVLPHLYEELGPEFVRRLNGIFGFALWDGRRRRLFLARDHLGVKPLYLHRTSSGVRFASELKALLCDPAVPRDLDLVAVDQYLTFRFTPAPRTLLANIEKLPPASVMLIDEDGSSVFRFWEPEAPPVLDIDLDEAAHRYLDLLRASVHSQMMSDRPIGAMLSGGVDSAAIVALMSEVSSRIHTFTVGFEGGIDTDETALARETARLFATNHTDLVVRATDFRESLASTVEMLEEPVGTTSALGFRTVAALAREHVPVLLSGQGADELVGGYWRYVGEWIASRASTTLGRVPGAAQGARTALHRVRSTRLRRGLEAVAHPDVLDRFMQIYSVFDENAKTELYGDGRLAESRDAGSARLIVDDLRRRAASRDSLGQMMYVDTRLWLPDDLLLVTDKMSMAESVETRVPFLDPALVEFVESLPTRYKVSGMRRKIVHKRALRGLVPDAVIDRKERGFITPVDRWLRRDMRGYARDVLLDADSLSATVFDRGAVERLLRSHASGAADHTRQLFCLLSLELWARRFLAPAERPVALSA